MTQSLVLLTGATGFVGAHVLHELITKGYRVIVPIRPSSASKADFFIEKYKGYPGALRFVEVADQTDAAAFVPHLKGVEAIIHTASILPAFKSLTGDAVKEVLDPVAGMVTALFEAALQVDSVKRFVLTSSSTAVYGTVDLSKKEYTEDDWNSITLEDVQGPWNPSQIYRASKTFGEKKLWKLAEEYKPAFDVVILCPPMVLGKSHHEVKGLSNLGGSAGPMFLRLVDMKEVPENICPQFINAVDSAEAHAAAITAPLPRTPDVPHRYLISSGTVSFHRLIPVLLERYPQLAGRLPDTDPEKRDEVFPPFATEKVKKELGVKLDRGWEESIVEGLFSEAFEYL